MENEEEKNEKFVAEQLAESTAPVDETNDVDIVAQANEAAQRLEDANKATAALLQRQERLAVANTLGGSAEAGAPGLSDEQKAQKSAKKFLEGTGFDEELFPDV